MQDQVVSIIDDDPSVREGTTDLLNSAGFFAETFNDAEEFLKSGNVDGTACVVADMRMPGMSGLDLHSHLLTAGQQIPTILITAFPKEHDRVRAHELGVCGYLSKPFSENDLLSYVRTALANGRGSRSALSADDSQDKRRIPTNNRAISKSKIDRPMPKRATLAMSDAKLSLFHEPWWLSAATGGQYKESVVKQDTVVVGRLPYVVVHRGPFRTIRMPPFTHMLGPAIDSGGGKQQTRLARRLSITRSLIDQLPANSFFLQHLDPSLDEGLASADALAFQERKFAVSPQYTFELDCRRSSDELWAAMNQKTRQPIRRAEEQLSVRKVDDPRSFVDFYRENTKAYGRANRLDFTNFSTLFSECRTRDCAVILGAFDHDGTPVAMTYLVWGYGTMYYLLSTRSPASGYGAVSLLLWSAMKHAHELGLVLDLDGVYSSGTARFLSSFGGRIKTRLMIRRSRMPYQILQFVKQQYAQEETQFFT